VFDGVSNKLFYVKHNNFFEDTMNISDVVFEMELNGVDASDITSIVELCRDKGFNSEFLDEELLKKGYPRIFSINYEEYDDFDDDYFAVEKFPNKNLYRD